MAVSKVSVPRIGRVKLKGGADLHIIQPARLGDMETQLIDDARALASSGDAPMQGFAIVTWDATASAGYALKFEDSSEGGVYPESIPHFTGSTIARCMRAHGLSD